MREEMAKFPSREYAGVLDEPVEFKSETCGCDPSPDAIGGYYGIWWYQYYRDRETGEVYKVYCSDGVNGGKGAYTDTDEGWRLECYDAIVKRVRKEAAAGMKEIGLSPNEWVIMKGFIHAALLESSPEKCDGEQAGNSIKHGLIGHHCGIPVIVDPAKEDILPPRQ